MSEKQSLEFQIVLLKQTIEDLQQQVQRLVWIIEFHKLDQINIKYCKAFPMREEYPYFETDKFKCDILSLSWQISGRYAQEFSWSKLKLPEDPLEYTKAKERMLQYGALYNGEDQVYYELFEKGEDCLDHCKVGECLDLEEAKKWAKEGGTYFSSLPELRDYPFYTRKYIAKIRRIPKPNSLAESPSASSSQGDSPQ